MLLDKSTSNQLLEYAFRLKKNKSASRFCEVVHVWCMHMYLRSCPIYLILGDVVCIHELLLIWRTANNFHCIQRVHSDKLCTLAYICIVVLILTLYMSHATFQSTRPVYQFSHQWICTTSGAVGWTSLMSASKVGGTASKTAFRVWSYSKDDPTTLSWRRS